MTVAALPHPVCDFIVPGPLVAAEGGGEHTWGRALRLGADLLPIGVAPVSRTRAEAMATLWQARTRRLLEGER